MTATPEQLHQILQEMRELLPDGFTAEFTYRQNPETKQYTHTDDYLSSIAVGRIAEPLTDWMFFIYTQEGFESIKALFAALVQREREHADYMSKIDRDKTKGDPDESRKPIYNTEADYLDMIGNIPTDWEREY